MQEPKYKIQRATDCPFGLIENQLKQVKKLIDKQQDDCDRPIGRWLADFNGSGGKMIRPALVLLSGSACGKITGKHIHIAAIFETIHNATLLHDDVIDQGQKRRGVPTVNSLHGNESAVLLGDFLLSRVFKMCSELEPQIARIISVAAARTCQGELRQVIQRQDWQMGESEYINIIKDKTAALFGSSCYLGAFSAGATKKQLRAMEDFGINLGIAFQITDDLLDIIGNEKKTGKTLGSDVDKSKPTLAIIHLLRTAGKSRKKSVMKNIKAFEKNKKVLMKGLNRFGSLEYAKKRAQEYAAKAVKSLADLKESKAKSALVEISKFVVARAG